MSFPTYLRAHASAARGTRALTPIRCVLDNGIA